jgi:hypothetical protein
MPNLSGLIASAIALLAVAIAWGQWYTARLKLILDLFNQRMEVYDEPTASITATLLRMLPATE